VTSRRPPGRPWESLIDRRIREAQERGEFDDLPGAGKPLPDLDRPHDDLWWVRRKLRDERLSALPPVLQVRKELEETRARLARATSEQEVRDLVAGINARIRAVNRTALQGPPSTVAPLDEEAAVRAWREPRAG